MMDCRLIAIPPANELSRSALISASRAAERGGATAVQLRLKDTPAGAQLAAAADLVRALAIPVYINDRADVARLAGATGVHVGADDLPPALVRVVAARPMRVGISVGSEAEAERGRQVDADYWSVGPFRSTTSKADAGAALGADGFRRLALLAPPGVPVIAIGGVDTATVPEVIRAGGAGVAVISAVFSSEDVTGATRRLRAALDEGLAEGG